MPFLNGKEKKKAKKKRKGMDYRSSLGRLVQNIELQTESAVWQDKWQEQSFSKKRYRRTFKTFLNK